MPPPDQQQVVKLPMPEGMNTVLPPYKLSPRRSPYILNMVSLNGQLVGRGPMVGAATSTATNRYPFSYITIPGRFSQITMIYQYTKATAGTYYVPYWLNQGGQNTQIPAIATTIITTLTTNTSEFTFSYYTDKNRQLETVASATTDMSSKLPGPQFSNYNSSAYAPNCKANVSLDLLRWGGSAVTTTAAASYIFVQGSTTVNYTALSPSSYTNLANQILIDPISSLTYRIDSQSVVTATTGSIELDVPWRTVGSTDCESILYVKLEIGSIRIWFAKLV